MTWLSVRTLLIFSVLHDLEARSIDFTLTFPQADQDVDFYMELPPGFDMNGSTGNHLNHFMDYVIVVITGGIFLSQF